jgi:cardiolipin synthase A/B
MSSPHSASQDAASRYRRALEGLIGVPATEGNRVDVLRNGDEIFPAMLEAIAQARYTVDLLTFVYWSGSIGGEFAEALSGQAQAGLRVRVLLDAVGARDIDERHVSSMQEAGCDVRWFRPVKRGDLGDVNHRTHRKVMVCDEEVAFTGGVGIADNWLGDARSEDEWRDTHFRLQGPAVDGLRAAFVDNWAETGGDFFDPDVDRFPDHARAGSSTVQTVRGAAETGWSDVSTVFRSLLVLAEARVRMTTAYFNPDDYLLELLCATAGRGVELQILLPGPHADKRFVQLAAESTYQRLLDAGVEVWNYSPSMLHAKVMTVDSLVANVGSANVNNRSTQLDEEVGLVVFDPNLVEVLDRQFDDDLALSEQIDASRWEDRSVVQRAAEKAVTAIKKVI